MNKNIKLALLLFLTINSKAQNNAIAEGFYKQAKHYDSLGDNLKAIEYFSKTILLDSNYLNAYFNRGALQIQQKNYKDALCDFKRFDKLSPNDFEVQYLFAACYNFLEDSDASLIQVNKSLTSKPDFFNALKLRAHLYLKKDLYLRALQDLDKALLINKADSEIYLMKAFGHEGVNDSINALKNYLIAVEMGYKNAVVFNNIGAILAKLNRQEQAVEYYDKSILMNPEFALAYYNRGLLLYDLGFKEEALSSLKKAKGLGFNSFNAKSLEILNRN